MQTWNSLACQPKGYGTQVTFKACGLLVVSTCMVSILFDFCLDSRLFNFVWSHGKRVSCISSLWLLVTLLYGLNTFSFHCIIICCLQNYQQIYFVSCKLFQSHLFSRQLNIGTLLFLLCLSAKHVHYMIWF